MLRSIDEVKGYRLRALDGEFGRCKDFLFDDHHWTIRYMVADTGSWLPKRKVLVSPIFLGDAKWTGRVFEIALTQEQIERAPHLDHHAPVNRQYERLWAQHYGTRQYWAGTGMWGGAPYPTVLAGTKRAMAKHVSDDVSASDDDPHLRSVDEVMGYQVATETGNFGYVEDFIVDDTTWCIRYMVLKTRKWLPGRSVLISPKWIGDVDWLKEEVQVDLSENAIKNSPEFDPGRPVNRGYEVRLYDYYGRPYYWDGRQSGGSTVESAQL